MNNEIKEILDKLKDTADTSFFAVCGSQEELDKMPKSITKILSIPSKDAKILLDYITNLQEAIETIKSTNKLLIQQKVQLQDDLDMLDNRIDKAIEYIKQYREVYYPDEPLSEPQIIYNAGVYDEDFDEEKLLNILQGEDKDVKDKR